MPPTFEVLTYRDLSEVKAIYDEYILNSTATFHTDPVSIDQLLEFMYVDHPVYRSFFIRSEGEAAGYCFLANHKKRQAYDRTAEVTIYLKPDFCGRGWGKAALQHLEQAAKDVGLKNLVGTISGDNQSSIALFERSGFTKCAHYKNVGEKFGQVLDVVAYQKELP